ncbi:MAG TPA: glucans biosynthesis glucosyltransferase MdoH [Xanthobacteraceae bacterium]|nr:glucans biosynthesis glucosyltransferase MdoH [Xanthobacteraceae bacterium]
MNHDEAATQRWLVLGLVLATTAVATSKLFAIFRVDGLLAEEWLLLAVFAVLFSWIAASFWLACVGAYELWREPRRRLITKGFGPPGPSRSRTVLAVPIYNEDSASVFAAIETMQDSLRELGALDRFDFFVLSDTRDPQCVADEENAWRRLRAAHPDARIYYRHRSRNVGRKSGNIADFCMQWGALYDYMVVLDADSLMSGRTLVKLAGLMDRNPRAGLIQVAPLLIGGETLFARMQQFASWVYGPIYVNGLARLQGADGNYWGHNAIIRVRAFMQSCGLPRLPGPPPLGGEILSHDFVEAALLRRAGWDVWLLPTLGGSYEATPPNLIDHLKRDQRWCQGNLQHVLLLFARGFRLQSRVHMAFGAISYLSSPLWLILIVLFSADAARLQAAAPVTFFGRYPILSWPVSHAAAFLSLIAATAVLLYGPKLLSVALLLRHDDARLYGGARALIVSVLAEILVSTLLAPILMISHSWFVANILAGRAVEWGKQRRGGGALDFAACAAAFVPHTLIAVIGGALAWYFIPGSIWWFLPLLAGLGCAIWLCQLTSDPQWGRAARRRGIFVVPSETAPTPLLVRLDARLNKPTRPGEMDRSGDSLQAA